MDVGDGTGSKQSRWLSRWLGGREETIKARMRYHCSEQKIQASLLNVTAIIGGNLRFVLCAVCAAERSAWLASTMNPSFVLVVLVTAVLGCSADLQTEKSTRSNKHTGYWAVDLHDGEDPNQVALEHGMIMVRRIRHFSNMYLFHRAGTHTGNWTDGGDHPHPSESSRIRWFQHQKTQTRHKREHMAVPPTDPLYNNQWFLHAHPDSDINIEEAWNLGYLGRGVGVAVVDDGIDTHHPEFSGRYSSEGSYDWNFHKSDPTPYSWDVHGIAACGVIAAAANNGQCGAGIAPESTIAGVRILAVDEITDADEAEGVAYRTVQEFNLGDEMVTPSVGKRVLSTSVDINHIYSNSWGPPDDGRSLEGPGPITKAAIEHAIDTGRDGKGSIFVWAGGNGFSVGDSCNYDGYASNRFAIAIAAFSYDGRHAYYSEACSALLASAPSSDRNGHSIVTAGQRQGCYTRFGGTSAASPVAAGVIALALEANPDLTWRDMQAVVIESAVPIDSGNSDWKVNGAGKLVSHYYGYGRVDAKRMVTTAANWQPLPVQRTWSDSDSHAKSIPDRSSVTRSIHCSEHLTVESVEIEFDATHSRRGQLEIVLTSPSGTDSILAQQHNDYNADYVSWVFTSKRLWGEDSHGDWKLKVTDKQSGTSGRLNYWKLTVYGH